MTEELYLLIKPGKWNKPRIAGVSKKPPNPRRFAPGTSAALVKLNVTLPDSVLIPRVPVATVEIKPEHIAAPTITATVQKP